MLNLALTAPVEPNFRAGTGHVSYANINAVDTNSQAASLLISAPSDGIWSQAKKEL